MRIKKNKEQSRTEKSKETELKTYKQRLEEDFEETFKETLDDITKRDAEEKFAHNQGRTRWDSLIGTLTYANRVDNAFPNRYTKNLVIEQFAPAKDFEKVSNSGDYEKADKMQDDFINGEGLKETYGKFAKHAKEAWERRKATAKIYNEMIQEKIDKNEPVYRFMPDTELDRIFEKGFHQTDKIRNTNNEPDKKGFTFDKTHYINSTSQLKEGILVAVKIPAQDMDFKILKATPYTRPTKTIKYGQHMSMELGQEEVRLDVKKPVPMPKSAEIIVHKKFDKKKLAELSKKYNIRYSTDDSVIK